jgi:hypothetical protein
MGSGDANAVVSFTVDGKQIETTVTADANANCALAGLTDAQHTKFWSTTEDARSAPLETGFLLHSTARLGRYVAQMHSAALYARSASRCAVASIRANASSSAAILQESPFISAHEWPTLRYPVRYSFLKPSAILWRAQV